MSYTFDPEVHDIATARLLALAYALGDSARIGPIFCGRLQRFIDSFLLPPFEPLVDVCEEEVTKINDEEFVVTMQIPVKRMLSREESCINCSEDVYTYEVCSYTGARPYAVTNKKRFLQCDLGELREHVSYHEGRRESFSFYSRAAELRNALTNLNGELLLLCGLPTQVPADSDASYRSNYVFDVLGHTLTEDVGECRRPSLLEDEVIRYFTVSIGVCRSEMLKGGAAFFSRYRAENYKIEYVPTHYCD